MKAIVGSKLMKRLLMLFALIVMFMYLRGPSVANAQSCVQGCVHTGALCSAACNGNQACRDECFQEQEQCVCMCQGTC